MSENQTTLLFNRNSAGEVDDSELINSYDKQYEKVKKKAKGKLPPIDSMSELSFDDKKNDETPVKGKQKKKITSKQSTPSVSKNSYQDTQELIPPPPPPPPDSIKNLPKTEREALTSMLMSYYMSGFHSGYYLGMKQNKSEK